MTAVSYCWFLTGSQGLYGPETLQQVERQSQQIVDQLNESGQLPLPVRNVVGDLADTNRLLAGLQLQLPASDTTWPAGQGARNPPGSRSDSFHQIQPDFS